MNTLRFSQVLSLAVIGVATAGFLALPLISNAATAPNWDASGNWVFDQQLSGTDNPVDVTLSQDGSGNLTGNGTSGTYAWTIDSGSVSGDAITFTAHYTATADAVNPLTVMTVNGTFAADGTITGTWSDNYNGGSRSGAWTTTSGQATAIPPAPTPCTTGLGSPLLVDHTQQISNDPDSSVPGPDWAHDTFSRHIQIWQEGSVYCAEADDSGTFTSIGGANGISPQSGAALPEIVTGSFTGSTHGEITGGTFNASNNPSDIDCSTDPTTCSNGLTSYWVSSYFGNSGSYDYGSRSDGWGWTYNGGANGTWVNASSGNSGDILHVANSTVYVDASTGNDSNAGDQAHPFATIQAAVNAVASGGTVNVDAGTYDSFSVSGKTGITISGAGVGSTIIAPSTLIDTGTAHKYTADVQASVFVNNSTNVVIQGMTIQSTNATPGSAGADDAIVFWNGSSGTIANSNVTGTYTINGAQTGQGIAVDAASGTDNLTVNNVDISGFQKNAIEAIDGNGATSGASDTINVTVTGGSINGAGSTGAIAQNGIVVWNRGGGSVNATISGATISGFDYTGANTAAGGLAYGGGNLSSIKDSSFSNNQLNLQTTAGSPAIDATQNYWGSASGPATSTLDGSITYSPWFTDAGMTNLAYATSSTATTTTTTTGSSTTTETAPSSNGTTTVTIAPNTTITGNSSWDGTFTSATTTSGVAVTADSGDTATVVEEIEVGSSNQSLQLSRAARIDFAGKAGDLVGWSVNGNFTQITATCSADDQTTEDTNLAAGADCKMNVGGDLVVWTKHFTTFAVYTEVTTPVTTTTGGGGGGGGGNGPIAGGGGGGGGPVAVALPNNGGAPAGTVVTTTTGGSTGGQVLGASTYNFANNLSVGSTGQDVTELQTILIADGYLNISAPTGYFGPLTKAAVKLYQSANGIPNTGYVGVLTRASLNAGTTPNKAAELLSLQAQLRAVLAVLASLGATTTVAGY